MPFSFQEIEVDHNTPKIPLLYCLWIAMTFLEIIEWFRIVFSRVLNISLVILFSFILHECFAAKLVYIRNRWGLVHIPRVQQG